MKRRNIVGNFGEGGGGGKLVIFRIPFLAIQQNVHVELCKIMEYVTFNEIDFRVTLCRNQEIVYEEEELNIFMV